MYHVTKRRLSANETTHVSANKITNIS